MKSDSPAYLDKNTVAKAFGAAASQYDKAAVLQKDVGERLLERLDFITDFQPKACVDVGTGSGRIAEAIAKKYKHAQVYAVDQALPMLGEARKRVPWHKTLLQAKQRHFVCADAAYLPFKTNSVDLIISNLMLQWCNDLPRVFQEFARILRPDGVLLFSTFGPDTLSELRQSWATVDTNHSHVNQFVDMHDIGDALLYAQLKNPVMDIDWLTYHYDDAFALMHWLKEIGAHNVTAGRAKGLTGKNKFKAMMAAYDTLRSESGLPATFEIVYGHAIGQQLKQNQDVNGDIGIPVSHIGGRK